MKTLVIGDTHGCLEELQALLKKAKPDLNRERLVMLGDYIDRGPQSYELIQYLQKLQLNYGKEKVVLLRGNHEQMAIDHFEHADPNCWSNGFGETMNSFARHQADIKEAFRFFKSLPLYFEDEQFIYVHAGLRPGLELKKQPSHALLWSREEFISSTFDFGKTVIFGHTVTRSLTGNDVPVRRGNKVALDTACVYGGRLSALAIENGMITRLCQVPGWNRHSKKIA